MKGITEFIAAYCTSYNVLKENVKSIAFGSYTYDNRELSYLTMKTTSLGEQKVRDQCTLKSNFNLLRNYFAKEFRL